MNGFLDRPDLGCAMLIAACQEKGIKTTLIKGQTRYLKDMFVTDSEELWSLIQGLKENDLKKIGIVEYKKSIQEKGVKQFQDELKSLYHYLIIDKNPRVYFNAQIVEKLNNLHNIFIGIYFYYLRELNCSKLKIIDRYVYEIINSNPHYIGFSLQSFGPLSSIIIKRIKELTEIPIIVGGSLTPFIDLKELDKIFEKEYFDYLIIGCGERVLPSLIESLDNKAPKGIANVFYKKDGKIICNDLKVIGDLDSLPYPDFSQFDLDIYLTPKRILPLQTARGCSWRKCAFCTHSSIYFGTYNSFSIEKVTKTIEHLQNTYGCSHFVFHDEELPPTRAKRISEDILNNDLKDISIYCYARLDREYNNNKLLQCLRKAGFSTIAWGMESGCQRVLDLINKGTKVSVMSQILKKSSKNKIANICFIFFGFPGETEAEAQQTIEFLKKHADYIEDILSQSFVLNLNSPIRKNPEKWGIDIKEDGTYSFRTGMIPAETEAFFSKFHAELVINSIRVSSDKLKHLLPTNNRRMLRFLSSSQELLPKAILLEYLIKGKLNDIFPIILGEIKKKNGKTIFYPIDITKTTFINQNFPKKEKVLDSLEKEIFILSEGKLSIEDIILAVYKDFKNEYREKEIRKKCTDFLRDSFIKNLSLGFAKPW